MYTYIHKPCITTLYCHSFKNDPPFFPTMNTDAEECFFLFECCCQRIPQKWMHCYFNSGGVPCDVCYDFFFLLMAIL